MISLRERLESRIRQECSAMIEDGHDRFGVEREHFGQLRMLDLLWPVIESAEKQGTQCANTGQYGPLKIAPGECTCSRCELKQALAKLEQEVDK